MKYNYTQTWFLNSEIRKNIIKHININNKINFLEIGCYEGLSSCFFSDIIINHNDSTLDCVDPFYKSGSAKGITTQHVSELTKDIFLSNISKSKNFKKIKFYNTTSDDFFLNNNKKYDFIYIDGCHNIEFIKRDFINSFKVLNLNGIIWMDDYLGGNNNDIKNTIDNLILEYNDKIKIIHKNYQIAFKKIQ